MKSKNIPADIKSKSIKEAKIDTEPVLFQANNFIKIKTKATTTDAAPADFMSLLCFSRSLSIVEI